jgi:hypothetical protein
MEILRYSGLDVRGLEEHVERAAAARPIRGWEDFIEIALRDAGAPEEDAGAIEPIMHTAPKTGRNDPFPCGSGRKFKKCCGRDSN